MNQSVALTYDQLRLFVVTAMPYAFDLAALSHADHPLTAIEALERKSQAQAMSGIKMAASDLVSMFANEPAYLFIKNAMKSVRFAHEGVNTLSGDPIVNDVSKPE